jgi:phage shock protein E
MGLFGLFQKSDINSGIEEFKTTAGAVLLDVRTKEEYQNGHIEGSVNIPLDSINTLPRKFPNKNTALFVYCHSGARSEQAVRYLRQMGYNNVKNIGGIAGYSGKVVLK